MGGCKFRSQTLICHPFSSPTYSVQVSVPLGPMGSAHTLSGQGSVNAGRGSTVLTSGLSVGSLCAIAAGSLYEPHIGPTPPRNRSPSGANTGCCLQDAQAALHIHRLSNSFPPKPAFLRAGEGHMPHSDRFMAQTL